MSIDTVQAAVLEVVNLISNGQYDDALQMCSLSRLTEKDIGWAIRSYGRTFVRPPANFNEYVDVVAIKGGSRPAWSIRVPLWTLEEGRSDLTLELTVADATSGALIELDDLRVL